MGVNLHPSERRLNPRKNREKLNLHPRAMISRLRELHQVTLTSFRSVFALQTGSKQVSGFAAKPVSFVLSFACESFWSPISIWVQRGLHV